MLGGREKEALAEINRAHQLFALCLEWSGHAYGIVATEQIYVVCGFLNDYTDDPRCRRKPAAIGRLMLLVGDVDRLGRGAEFGVFGVADNDAH